MPTEVVVVEKGWAATKADPPVKALKREDFPELGRPTSPRRSTYSKLHYLNAVGAQLQSVVDRDHLWGDARVICRSLLELSPSQTIRMI